VHLSTRFVGILGGLVDLRTPHCVSPRRVFPGDVCGFFERRTI
jgi:hypothetical protein